MLTTACACFEETWWRGYHKTRSYFLQLSICNCLIALSGGPYHELGEDLIWPLTLPRQQGLRVSSEKEWLAFSPQPTSEILIPCPSLPGYPTTASPVRTALAFSWGAQQQARCWLNLCGAEWAKWKVNIIAFWQFVCQCKIQITIRWNGRASTNTYCHTCFWVPRWSFKINNDIGIGICITSYWQKNSTSSN